MPLESKSLKDILSIFTANLFSKVMLLASAPVLVFFAGSDLYGKWEYYLSISLLMDTLLSFKILEGYFRFESKAIEIYQSHKLVYFSTSFYFIVGVYILLLVASLIYGELVFTLILFFSLLKNVFLLGIERYRALGLTRKYSLFLSFNTLLTLIAIVFVSTLYKTDLTVTTLLLSFSLILFVQIVLISKSQGWIALLFNKTFFDKHVFKEMICFSMPLIPSAASWWIVKFSGLYFVNKFYSSNELGLFSISAYLPSILMMFGLTVYISVQKKIYDVCLKSNEGAYILKIITFIYTGICLIMIAIGPLFYRYFFDVELNNYWTTVFELQMFSALIFNLGSLLALHYTVEFRTKELMFSTIVSAFIVVTGNYLLYDQGIFYIAFSSVFGLLILFMWRAVSYGLLSSSFLIINVSLTALVLLLGQSLILYDTIFYAGLASLIYAAIAIFFIYRKLINR